jgi:hypothetical protein
MKYNPNWRYLWNESNFSLSCSDGVKNTFVAGTEKEGALVSQVTNICRKAFGFSCSVSYYITWYLISRICAAVRLQVK